MMNYYITVPLKYLVKLNMIINLTTELNIYVSTLLTYTLCDGGFCGSSSNSRRNNSNSNYSSCYRQCYMTV